MTEEELAALKLKYEGKLARLLNRGRQYNSADAIGVVLHIGRNLYFPDRPSVTFRENGPDYFFNYGGFTLELHPSQEVNRD